MNRKRLNTSYQTFALSDLLRHFFVIQPGDHDSSAAEFSDFDVNDQVNKKMEERPEDFIERSFKELKAGAHYQDDAHNEVKRKRIRAVLCACCALGILIFYLLFGILQEDITKDGYGEGYPDGPDYWVFMITLVWVCYNFV